MIETRTRQVPLLRTMEGLRFVASIGIASIHVLPHVGVDPPDSFQLFVDLFFVVSGIVIGGIYVGAIASWRDYGIFLRKRFARLYPLHLATLTFYIVLGVGVARYHLHVDDPSRYDPAQIVPNLLLMQAWFPDGKLSYNFVSWSISAEVFAYLVFPLLALGVSAGGRRGLALVVLLLALTLAAAHLWLHSPLYLLRWNMGILRVLPSFAFGVWLSVFAAQAPARLGRRAPALFAAALVLFVVALTASVPGYLMMAACWLLVAAGFLADLHGARTLLSARWLSTQGRLTYSIYMLHVPVTTVFLSFAFPRLFGVTPAARLVSLVLTCGIVWALSAASFAWFENPLRRLIGGGAAARPVSAGGGRGPG